MSQPSSDTGNAAPTREDEQPEPLSFTLAIVSPSVGVASRLNFPHLLATTTVKQLKAKIRDSLPSRPPDENQRLIHRGRMLAREGETMLDIFGKETLCNPELQTLHLVLRPAEVAPPPAPTLASASGPPAIPQPIPRPNSQALAGNPLIAQLPRPQSTSVMEGQGVHGQQPLPGFQHVQNNQNLHQMDQTYQQMLLARLHGLQRETQRVQQEMAATAQGPRPHHAIQNSSQVPQIPGAPQGMFQLPQLGMRPLNGVPPPVQAFIAQQQRVRAAEGRTGVQGNANPAPGGLIPGISSGRASPILYRPDHQTTYTREGVGPNGERWHMTVNESTTTLPLSHAQHLHHHHHHPPPLQTSANAAAEIQAIMRSADRRNATQETQSALDAMQRSASNPNPDLGRSTPVPDTSATGIPPTPVTRAAPTPSANTASSIPTSAMPSGANATAANVNPAVNSDNVVYILSSPQGPRALLISDSETYYTPRQWQHRRNRLPSPTALQGLGEAVGLPENPNRPIGPRVLAARRNRRGVPRNEAQPAAPRANPGAGGLAAQIGPILWLIIRLAGMVWFLTQGNPSWTRWFMVSGIAFIIFIVNTGLFNGAADQVWGPIRRHLEALIPLAGPDAAMIPAANAAAPQPEALPVNEAERQGRARREPDPAETAARLLEQHRRANGGWLVAQIRRAEHSLLLFLASLVPGVGERHIAAREAEEVERQRRIDSAAAAAHEAEQAGTNGEQAATADGQANGESATHPNQEEEQGDQENRDHGFDGVPPLVEV